MYKYNSWKQWHPFRMNNVARFNIAFISLTIFDSSMTLHNQMRFIKNIYTIKIYNCNYSFQDILASHRPNLSIGRPSKPAFFVQPQHQDLESVLSLSGQPLAWCKILPWLRVGRRQALRTWGRVNYILAITKWVMSCGWAIDRLPTLACKL